MLPMLASPIELGNPKFDKQWARMEDYTMELKLDGMRLLLHFGGRGQLIEATTRSGRSVFDCLPREWVAHVRNDYLRGVVLDCEFGYTVERGAGFSYPLIDFNKTMRVMGSGPATAQAKALEHQDLPCAHVFDIVSHEAMNGSLSQEDRRAILLRTIEGDEYLRVTDSWEAFRPDLYAEYVQLGGEGVMLKNPDAVYIEGKRPPQTWYKLKKFNTIDVVITGFQEGQGKYKGQIGAIKFGVYQGYPEFLKEIGQCSGMTDAERRSITKRAGFLLGSVMEVRYFGLTAGTPRHPQFVRLRPDKDRLQCRVDQIT